jgi:hypothetical protein
MAPVTTNQIGDTLPWKAPAPTAAIAASDM